ncbi:MAG: class I SAM-dependent methyltransferase [Planctomycetaceae bacterium]
MPRPSVESWSQQYAHRRAVAARFGGVFELPLAKRARDVLLSCVDDGQRVLEVGAGDRRMGDLLRGRNRDVTYASMDIDPRGDHDYTDLSDVDGVFDAIFAFEVVEHIPVGELPGWLAELASLLKPAGRLILSTPNIYYPPAYLRDVTHCTPLCFDELGALAQSAGLTVTDVRRIYNDPAHRIALRRYVFGWLFRLLGIDFARQIVLVAEKPATAARIAA